MKKVFLSIAIALIGCSKQVPVTGTYEYKNEGYESFVKVNQIEKDVIQFSVSAVNPQFNVGEISGTAKLVDGTFKFTSQDEDCDFEMRFKDKKLSIKQNGSCMFGASVWAGFDNYKLVDNK